MWAEAWSWFIPEREGKAGALDSSDLKILKAREWEARSRLTQNQAKKLFSTHINRESLTLEQNKRIVKVADFRKLTRFITKKAEFKN